MGSDGHDAAAWACVTPSAALVSIPEPPDSDSEGAYEQFRYLVAFDSSNVFRLILQEGAVLVLAGLAVGLAGAVGLRSFIETQLYNVRPLDPWILSAVVACLAGIALAACAAPARGATRVDPVRVLNE